MVNCFYISDLRRRLTTRVYDFHKVLQYDVKLEFLMCSSHFDVSSRKREKDVRPGI